MLHKSPTGVLKYVNATLFTLLHSYMLQPSRGHPQGILTHFLSWVNNSFAGKSSRKEITYDSRKLPASNTCTDLGCEFF